jgi:hypothetical protein
VACAVSTSSSSGSTSSGNTCGGGVINTDDLRIYLSVMVPLLLKYYIPGVLKSSRSGGESSY